MNQNDVLVAIRRGELDEGIEALYEALGDRSKQIRAREAARVKASVKPGDVLRFGPTTRPQYLIGLHAEVESLAGGHRINVRIVPEHRARAQRYGRGTIKAVATTMEPVEVDA